MLKLETIAELGFTLEEEIGFEGRNSHVFKSYYPAFKTYLVTKSVIQHAKGTGDQQLMGPSKSAKITYQTPPLSITL